MASFRISWKTSAAKELKRLPKDVIAKVLHAVEQLATDPHPPQSKKLVGSQHTYRIRVGDYRVIYNVLSNQLSIEVVRVGNRRDVYR